MDLPFTHKPGRRERHLRRLHENPLFGWPPREVEPQALLAAQKADHDDMVAFRDHFRALIQRAVDLPPDAGSDEVLGLKEALERGYEQTFGLPEDHAEERAALKRLIDLTMKAIRRQAGADPLARQELDDEEAARAIHFRLLEQPLIADLLHPESPIGPQELVPALLSASEAEAAAACELFDAAQLAQIAASADALMERLSAAGAATETAAARLAGLRLALAGSGPGRTR
jgi:hypothetical protein